METWIIVLVVTVALVVLIIVIDCAIKYGARRKPRMKNVKQDVPAAPTLDELYQNPNSFGGINIRRPSAGVYIVPREITPVHSVNPSQYGYPVSYEDVLRQEKYGKQMPYNPSFQNQTYYQYQ